MFVLPVIKVSQNVSIFSKVCFYIHDEFYCGYVVTFQFLVMLTDVFVRSELHDSNGFRKLLYQYFFFEYVFYCFETIDDPSFFLRHHNAIVLSLTGMIYFAPITLFFSELVHVKINVLREDGVH